MLTYEFMRTAFAAAFVTALVSAACGYFLVLRRQAFAGHALGHIGFAGATGAVLLGLAPFPGLLLVTTLGGALMGYLGESLAERDVAIGVVLALALGLGLLFLNFFTSSAVQATSLLFGNILGVDRATLWHMAVAAALVLAGLALIARPLLLASLRPELAEARGTPLRLISVLFLAMTGIAVAEAVQAVGVLLVFTLMVSPAAAAQKLSPRIVPGFILALVLACAQAMAGVALAWLTDWPASFWISLLGAASYGLASVSWAMFLCPKTPSRGSVLRKMGPAAPHPHV